LKASASLVTREAGTSQPAGRRSRRRLSTAHVLVGLAVVLAFVLNILALQDRDARTLVAVADRPIPAGAVLTADMVRLVPIDYGFEALDSFVVQSELEAAFGQVTQRAIGEGQVIPAEALVDPGSQPGKRSMSIPVEVSRAAGGLIGAGDLVDVIRVVDGVARFVVTGIEVVAVPASSQGAFSPVEHHLVVAVDSDQALALAEAMAAGRIDVVLSTGAPSVGAVSDGITP
jgi:Flp pilus assembly protein CpaB